MAILTADKQLEMRNPGEIREFPVIASDIIYKGALVTIDATGYAEPAANVTGLPFVGVAVEQADNSAGASGAINVKVYTAGTFRVTAAGIVQADLGKLLFVADDQSVDDGGINNFVAVGTLEELVSATDVWVRINQGTTAPNA